MKITRVSPLTGIEHVMELPVTIDDLARCWSLSKTGTEHVQDVFPNLSPGEREFLISGIPPEEWEQFLGPGEDEDDE